MATVLGSPYLSSPDMQSSVFPDRLIRPLPRRSLRSRLSEEAADAIPFPPNPPSSSFPSYNHYGEHGDFVNDSKVLVQQEGECCDHEHHLDQHRQHQHQHRHQHQYQHQHDQDYHHHPRQQTQTLDHDAGSDEDNDRLVPNVQRSTSHKPSPPSPRTSRNLRHHAGRASYSGSDGYDAFENTNNKKKRKIPTHGSIGLHQSSLSAELAHLGLGGSRADLAIAQDGGAEDEAEDPSGLHTSNVLSSNSKSRQGKDTARRVSGRSPLGISNSNPAPQPTNYASSSDDPKSADQGIISAAIANATALLRKPLQKGQENAGVPGREPQSSPTNTQFTFTCETDAAKGVTFPEQSLYSAGYIQQANHCMQPNAANGHLPAGQEPYTHPTMQPNSVQYPQPAVSQGAAHAPTQGKKSRRRRGDLYALAARQRRLQQEYTNLHHPPSPEDIWICEFCEYESIFGVAPLALIRQYEIKDRKERKRLAEKRRLLEKAKMKGRKGKKQTKNAAKAANGTHPQPLNQQAYDQQPMDQLGGDDYLDDGYEDDSLPLPAPPPMPAKQSMPGTYDMAMGRHLAAGDSGKGTGGV